MAATLHGMADGINGYAVKQGGRVPTANAETARCVPAELTPELHCRG